MTGMVVRMVEKKGFGGASRRCPAGQRPPGSGGGIRAFTLIEILVVVSIIMILAAIAVPNFLEAQTRSKVSRARNDMRVMALALEAYHTDYNKYPDRSKAPGGLSFLGLADTKKRHEEIRVLTTPIAYVSGIPVDVFEIRVEPPNNVIDYYSPIIVEHMRDSRLRLDTFPKESVASGWTWQKELELGSNYTHGWMLLSVGPDTVLGNASRTQGNYPHQTNPDDITVEGPGTTWNQEYDPTNGTVSYGNLTRFQRHGATATDAFN